MNNSVNTLESMMLALVTHTHIEYI